MDQAEARELLGRLLDELRAQDPKYSLSRFGQDLGKMAGRAPYTKSYVAAMLKGAPGYPVSPALQAALVKLAAVHEDGMPEFQATLQPVPGGVLSLSPIPAGSVVMGQAKLCARDGCGLWFVTDNPRRRFCPRCRPKRK